MPIALELYAIALWRFVRDHLLTLDAEQLSVFAPLLGEGVRNGDVDPAHAHRAAAVLKSTYGRLRFVWMMAQAGGSENAGARSRSLPLEGTRKARGREAGNGFKESL